MERFCKIFAFWGIKFCFGEERATNPLEATSNSCFSLYLVWLGSIWFGFMVLLKSPQMFVAGYVTNQLCVSSPPTSPCPPP